MKRVYLIEFDTDEDETILELLKGIDPSVQIRQTMYKSLDDYDYQRELDYEA
ncbi:hypothetical protein LCGC14_2325930 [marine sediment metagenome]|uniref:Uncharacterized protein n=1 Tax=marine sediment metagenome TaxID=412755 RepID=A0A0F9FBC9_9ZZZZ